MLSSIRSAIGSLEWMNEVETTEPQPERIDAQDLLRKNSFRGYLITFSCYGSHLPGQEGTTDRDRNVPGTRLRESQPKLRHYIEASMKQADMQTRRAKRRKWSIRFGRDC